jgi:iron(III) transport system ATP-binding protein
MLTAQGIGSGVGVAAAPARTKVRLSNVTKLYPGTQRAAVDDLTLDIREGEIFGLLGPSGCGKTTTLRMVAGLEMPDRGVIAFEDRAVVDAGRRLFTPPEKRNVGMVFQSYAIWPHMTVEENVAYPLKRRRLSSADIAEKVGRVLDLVGMAEYRTRFATALSGGQQQRVALARALVYEPGILLLDEPFSNLDTKLREQMRLEVKALQAKLRITVLFVTHDQVEALSLSTRLAVMRQGMVEQVGTPKDLYERPNSPFVRDFLGRSIIVRGTRTADGIDGRSAGPLVVTDTDPGIAAGTAVSVSIRPEDIAVHADRASCPDAHNVVAGTLVGAIFLGERLELSIRLPDGEAVTIFGDRHLAAREGDPVFLSFPPDAARAWRD